MSAFHSFKSYAGFHECRWICLELATCCLSTLLDLFLILQSMYVRSSSTIKLPPTMEILFSINISLWVFNYRLFPSFTAEILFSDLTLQIHLTIPLSFFCSLITLFFFNWPSLNNIKLNK